MKFNELSISSEILKAIDEMGYEDCTYIQEKTIPLILEGKDIIGQSQTGTGKTAAYGIPLIENLQKLERRIPQVLILTPTRELTLQVTNELRKFAKYKEGIRIVSIYGGEPISSQIRDLKGGVDIIVGTPGRVMDHMERKTLRFSDLKAFVLDEADEMLKLGFKEDIEEILKSLPSEKQFLLFSATMPREILNITDEYLNSPIHIKTAQKEMTVNAIQQVAYEVSQGSKTDTLVQLLEFYRPDSCMIFCNTKKMVDDVAALLGSKGYNSAAIHGDLKQEMRTIVMDRFKQKKLNILVCTDVAARGIDIDDLDIVFNYDVPQEIEYYVHRIGRTGRAGKEGLSITLITPRQRNVLTVLERLTKASIAKKNLPTLAEIQAVRFTHLTQDVMNSLQKNDIPVEIKALTEKLVDSGLSPIELAQALLFKMVGKDIFTEIKEPINAVKRAKRVATATVQMDVGRKHNVAPAHIVSAIAEATGISGADIGKIRISEHNTTVEVPLEFLEDVLRIMNEGTIKGYKIKAFELKNPSAEPKRRYQNDSHGSYPNKHSFKTRHGKTE